MAYKFKAGNTTTVSWYFDESIGSSDIKVSIFDHHNKELYVTYLSDGKIIEGTATIEGETVTTYILVITSVETQGWSGDLKMYFLLTDSGTVPTVNSGQTSITLPFEVTPDTKNLK